MADSSAALAEALARIEHKLDFVLWRLREEAPLFVVPPVGDNSHECPVCHEKVKYLVDIIQQVMVRACGCKTGKQPPVNLERFAPPITGGRRDERSGNEEAGDDASGSRSSRRRRSGK